MNRNIETVRPAVWKNGSALAAAALMGLMAGCGSPEEIRAAGSADEAQSVLMKSLDAWKSGTPDDSLASQEPAVVVVDQDWTSGKKLAGYELASAGVENGGHWRIPVRLTMEKSRTLDAWYAVTPGDPASIIRSDFSE